MKRLSVNVIFMAFILSNVFAEKLSKENIFKLEGETVISSNGDFSQKTFTNWGKSASDQSQNSKVKCDNNITSLEISYSGTGTWNVRQNPTFKLPLGKMVRVWCEAKKIDDNDGKFEMYLSGMVGGKKAKDKVVTVGNIRSGDFKTYSAFYMVDETFDEFYLRFRGEGSGRYEIKNLKVDYIKDSIETSPTSKNENVFKNGLFSGPLASRPKEKIGRGINIIRSPQGGQLITWRALETDGKNASFTVSKIEDGKEKLLSTSPISRSTNFRDEMGIPEDTYILRSYSDLNIKNETGKWIFKGNDKSYKSIKVKGKMVVRGGVAVGDLDGDGEYDYVLKTGNEMNIDPAETSGWHPSKEPLTLEAYKNNGEFLWKKCLGWNIESGIWYSPYVVCDLDGDGKCEVITKTGEDTTKGGKDYRGKDGRVYSGPQYLSVLDGMTGEEIDKVDWIDWSEFESYDKATRNQIAIAHLDGKTPCIVMLGGTYGHQEVKTFFLKNKKLVPIWHFENSFLSEKWQGQGAHWTVCVDIDEDGRDEIILGASVLDDDGTPLWTTGRGHPDAVYFGDINPNHPGYELVFINEKRQSEGGIMMTDLKGNKLWGLDEPTDHVHSQALCSDIDPKNPGREIYGMNSAPNHQKTERRWLFTSDGKILKKNEKIDDNWGFTPLVAYITDSPTSSILRSNEFKSSNKFRYDGTVIFIADIEGDWREEVFTSPKGGGELRIYSTVDVSKTKHQYLMSDNFYHSVVTNNSSGYLQHPEIPDGIF